MPERQFPPPWSIEETPAMSLETATAKAAISGQDAREGRGQADCDQLRQAARATAQAKAANVAIQAAKRMLTANQRHPYLLGG